MRDQFLKDPSVTLVRKPQKKSNLIIQLIAAISRVVITHIAILTNTL